MEQPWGAAASSPLSWGSLPLERPVVVPWGCELSSGARSCVLEEDDAFSEHLILLQTITLGPDAGDELHVVAVASKNSEGGRAPVPIASLRLPVLPTISLRGLELVPPVTFVLQSGAGPVYLHGQHLLLEDDGLDAGEDAPEEEAGDEDEASMEQDGE